MGSDRDIFLESFEQQMTYGGLLEGMPDTELNNHLIESALHRVGKYYCEGTKPHLILPFRRDYLCEPGDMNDFIDEGRLIPEWLSGVQCIASFKSTVKISDPDNDLSVLVVVWFQDEYAFPICEPVFNQLLELDGELLATDTCY